MSIDVDRRTVSELIEDLKSGKYYLPSFQRRWEWNSKKIKEFIDSILNSYPIGVIILWKPSNIKRVDPFSKPLYGEDREDLAQYLILDGQQRLTALLLMYNYWKIERKIKRGNKTINEKIEERQIVYNPNNNKISIGKMGIDISRILRAFYEDRDVEAFDYLKRYHQQQIEKLRELANKIMRYRIPIYIIETNNEDRTISAKMTEAFIRVNKEGVKIGSLELMLSYLGGYMGGEFSTRIRSMHDELENKIGLELQPLLRTIFSNMGVKQTDIKPEKFNAIVGKIQELMSSNPQGFKNIFDKSERAFMTLVEFLKGLGINDLAILPSQITLVPIAKFFYKKSIDNLQSLSDRELYDIEKWFVIANFRGYYSSQTDTKLEQDLKLIEESESFPISRLLKNMKKKRIKTEINYRDLENGLQTNVLLKAGRNYLFLLYLLLVKNDAENWAGKLIKDCKFSSLDKHHIIPRKYIKRVIEFESEDEEKRKVNCLGNITFIDGEIDSSIGDSNPREYLSNFDRDTIERHFIPYNENLWRIENIEDYETFLEERIKLIYKAGRRYYDFFI